MAAPPDETARRRAAALAGHRGDVGAARALLGDEAGAVRAAALGALARSSALDQATLDAALADPEPAVRRRAAEVAASAPGVEVAGARWLALLADDDPSVIEVAAWATGERLPPPAGAVAALAALVTGHDDALVREAAVAALGAIGDEAGLGAILAATRDKATVRRRAVLALAPFEGADVDEAVARALTDRDWQVRQAAEDVSE